MIIVHKQLMDAIVSKVCPSEHLYLYMYLEAEFHEYFSKIISI